MAGVQLIVMNIIRKLDAVSLFFQGGTKIKQLRKLSMQCIGDNLLVEVLL